MATARLDQVNIVVGDMDVMAAFYERLGYRFVDRDPDWAPHHRNSVGGEGGADVDLDSAAFAAVWNEGWPGGSGVVLSFRVDERDEVDRLHGELVANGATSQQEPWDAFFGARFACVADPEGNTIALMSVIDPARRTPPPPLPS